ncbi:MAG TPA: class I SAM-dependent methyltransferase, partial [Gammaproteobacteria bacterium]|nr:class I SAM-dependent methyltransferase [Gammaproteobacteria bacterium]
MVATEQSAQSTHVAASRSPAELPAAYERWRSSRLGRITDAIEERLVLDLLGPVRGLSVLDVGCGDGVLASALSRRGARVTGLDTDAQMLAAVDRRAQSQSIELHLVRGRAEALPFQGETFDRVVAVTVLCFVRETDRALSEIARILKPGG